MDVYQTEKSIGEALVALGRTKVEIVFKVYAALVVKENSKLIYNDLDEKLTLVKMDAQNGAFIYECQNFKFLFVLNSNDWDSDLGFHKSFSVFQVWEAFDYEYDYPSVKHEDGKVDQETLLGSIDHFHQYYTTKEGTAHRPTLDHLLANWDTVKQSEYPYHPMYSTTPHHCLTHHHYINFYSKIKYMLDCIAGFSYGIEEGE